MSELELDKINPILKKNGVSRAGIFGSYARNEANKKSDIDLLIKFKKAKSLLEIIRLERAIKGILGKEVDLVTESSLHPYIKKNVLNDLKIFYEGK